MKCEVIQRPTIDELKGTINLFLSQGDRYIEHMSFAATEKAFLITIFYREMSDGEW